MVTRRRYFTAIFVTVLLCLLASSAGVVTLPAERRFSGGPEESLRRFARA